MGGPKPRLPDWNPKGPRGKVQPRTFDEKVADDLRELEAAKQRDKATLEKWRNDAARRVQAEKDRERAHPEWMERRTRCIGSLARLGNQISIRKNDWANVAIDVSFAYEKAYTSFTELLDQKNTQDQFLFNVAFTALAAVSVGGLAVIFTKAGDKWMKSGATQLYVDTVEDIVQAGAAGLLSNVASPMVAASAKLEPTAIPSPFTIRGEMDKMLNDMESEMLTWCVQRQTDVNQLALSEFEFFSPEQLDKEIDQFLAEKDKKFNSKPFLVTGRSKFDLANELEKMMIGLWTVSFCEKMLQKTFRRRLPKVIIDRLVKHGFVSDAGHFSDADVLRIADWGPNTERVVRRVIANIKAYQAKKFG